MLLCFFLASFGLCFSITAQQTAPKGTTVPFDSMTKTLPADSVMKAVHEKTVSLIDERCAGCHGGKKPRIGLNLEPEMLIVAVKDVRSRQIDSLKLVDTRMPEKSYFLMKIRGDKGIKGSRMPDDAPALSAGEINMIDLWIRFISGSPRGSSTAPSAADSTRK
jgi:hypothetical protein